MQKFSSLCICKLYNMYLQQSNFLVRLAQAPGWDLATVTITKGQFVQELSIPSCLSELKIPFHLLQLRVGKSTGYGIRKIRYRTILRSVQFYYCTEEMSDEQKLTRLQRLHKRTSSLYCDNSTLQFALNFTICRSIIVI
jgi:hypothetical protein